MRHLLLLFLFAVACTTTQSNTPTAAPEVPLRPECISRRAAFDIGSGETRLNVSKVDICNHRVIVSELELKEAVGYKEAMSKGKSRYLSQEIMQSGFKVIEKMKKEAAKLSPDAYLGVATAVFREARNGQTFIDEVNKALRINARIITQQEEATIGYYAAISTAPANKKYVVWDIGGSSQQLIFRKEDNNFVTYEGKLASVSFKDRVMSEIKKQKQGSPNPLSAEQMKDSVLLAEIFATTDVPKEIKDFIKNPEVQILGIGGVLYYSVYKQAKGAADTHIVSVKDVDTLVQELTGKDNSYFADQKFVDTTITNVALVFGFMKALEMQKLSVYNVNLSHGLLVHPTLWKK